VSAETQTFAISLVVAVAENGVIGRNGALPWRVSADLRRFRAVTIGKPVVMGRKTFQSIGRPLDARDNIVVTRNPDFLAPGAEVAGAIEDAMVIAAERARSRGVREICVIGGSQVFAETLPDASLVHLTHVQAAPEGDVFFPPLDRSAWREVSREELPFRDGDTARAAYAVYQRIR
jgi:dihydrofolate reductase